MKTESSDIPSRISSAVSLIRGAEYLTAFTGAGISVESGIPPFRGPGGIWNTCDQRMFELRYLVIGRSIPAASRHPGAVRLRGAPWPSGRRSERGEAC